MLTDLGLAMDFDDMIVNTVKLLEENEEVRTAIKTAFAM